MDSSNTNPSNLSSDSSEGNEQEFRSYTAWLAALAFLLGFLLTLLGWKYQNPGVSVFDTHCAIILLLILNVCTCTISLAMIIVLPTSNKTHLSFFKNVFLFSGVFACDLVLLVLIPPLGWFIFSISVSVLVWLLYASHKLILRCCRQTLETMRHSTSKAFHSLCDWFPQSFQSVWRAHPQASTGPSMPTHNMEKHVFGSTNDV
ncbi:uncharacterized protein LOC115954761 [Quercus lobata]|uniref:uncharacterized protein LOC115954761 n=1 Tax=Quercus lobata TaxID=97700 RepID=UPI001246E7C8|nr:uncharacterized protein LOC115954761 [Quercus lobata]